MIFVPVFALKSACYVRVRAKKRHYVHLSAEKATHNPPKPQGTEKCPFFKHIFLSNDNRALKNLYLFSSNPGRFSEDLFEALKLKNR